MNKQIRPWFWPLLVAATIYFESSHGVVAGPDLPNFDKVAHFFIYGLLGTLLARAPGISDLRRAGPWLAILITSLYGVSDEWHQSFTPGRSVDFFDWLADTSGAALAVLCYTRWNLYHRVLEFTIGERQARTGNLETRITS